MLKFIVISYNINITRFKKNFDKFVAGPVSVSSLIECSAKCTPADGCVGVLYSPTLKACQLSSAVLSTPRARNDPVWTFYLGKL